jgi:hypothetical protein
VTTEVGVTAVVGAAVVVVTASVVVGAGAPVVVVGSLIVTDWVNVPPGVTIESVTAPAESAGTVIVICVSESTANVAAVDPKVTDVVPVKPVPVTTSVPPSVSIADVSIVPAVGA